MSKKWAIVSALFFATIPFCWMYYFHTPNAFGDTYGMIMAMIICLFFGMGFLVIAIASRENGFQLKYLTLTRTLIGIGLILYGFWIFSDKGRFAERAVVKTDAIIRTAYIHSTGCTIQVIYEYKDAKGQQYRGDDYDDACLPVYNQFASLFFRPGKSIPINYLAVDSSVSRLLPGQHNIVVYVTKALVIFIGILVIFMRRIKTRSNVFTAGPLSVSINMKAKDSQE